MILQALANLYDVLAAKGRLEQPGWSPVKVSWGLELDSEGNLKYLLPFQEEQERGRKKQKKHGFFARIKTRVLKSRRRKGRKRLSK